MILISHQQERSNNKFTQNMSKQAPVSTPCLVCRQCATPIKMLDTSWGSKYKAFGKHYGYPECCTENFIRKVKGVLSKKQIQKKPNTQTKENTWQEDCGFKPCDQCILNHPDDISKLIQNRECKLTLKEAYEVNKIQKNMYLRTFGRMYEEINSLKKKLKAKMGLSIEPKSPNTHQQ